MKVGSLPSLRMSGSSKRTAPNILGSLIIAVLLWPVAAALALDRVEARRGGVSMSGVMTGATEFQFGVSVSGTRDQKIEQLQRELRLLEFERDVFPELSREVSYAGTNRPITQCLADLSSKTGKAIPMDFGTNDFQAKEFVFEEMPLRDVLKYLVAFDNAILDVAGGKLVSRPVRQALALDQSEYDLLELMSIKQFGAVEQILTTNPPDIKKIQDQDGQTLLHLAAGRKQTLIAQRLVDLGADINTKDRVGYTPLHEAVRDGNRESTELLLKQGADVSIVDNKGDTPLETAIWYGFLDLANMLVDHGARLDIFTASALGRVDEVKKFLDQKSAQTTEPGNSTERTWYAFAHATDPVPKERFSPFVSATPLHCAARGGSVEAASLLVSRGAPISALDGQGKTPLFWAAEEGRLETAKFLIAHGADVNGTNRFGSTPLLTAARDVVAPELMKFLIQAGANVRITDGHGENALHKLAWYGCPPENVQTAQFLLDAGADISAKNKEGKTPLDILLDNSFQNPDLVKLYWKFSEQAATAGRK